MHRRDWLKHSAAGLGAAGLPLTEALEGGAGTLRIRRLRPRSEFGTLPGNCRPMYLPGRGWRC